MNETPEDGTIEEEKAAGESDIDSDDETKGQPNAVGEGEEISIEGKVDAIFEACDSNKDGVLAISEAKTII